VLRQAVWRNQHDVEAQGEASELRAAGEKVLEGPGNAAALARRYGLAGGGQRVARFDLDRGEHAATSRDDVDFAGGDAIAAGQHAIAAQPQMPDAQRLRGAATPPGPQASRRFARLNRARVVMRLIGAQRFLSSSMSARARA
jgi:hypothetical protein